MSTLTNFLSDGALLSFFTSLWVILAMWLNPRIFLHDYPAKIQEKVAPKTLAKKRLTFVFGIPPMLVLLIGSFFSTLSLKEQGNTQFWALWLNATGVALIFNKDVWDEMRPLWTTNQCRG